MNTPPITQTESLWNQKLKLSPNLKAGSDNEARLYVENLVTQAKYLLQGWQMALLASFESGELTIADCVREAASKFPGEINENGVRQFCQWVLNEKLADFTESPVMAQREIADQSHPAAQNLHAVPHPEVAAVEETREEEPINPIAQATLKSDVNEGKAGAPTKKSRPSRGNGAFASLVKIAACVAVGIGTWKFTTTVLPIVNGASGENLAVAGERALESHNATASSAVPAEIDVNEAAKDSAGVTEIDPIDREEQLKELREELANVQAERDVSYEKSDEAAYRNAVQKIAKITHQIGEIQAEMKNEMATENPGVAYGAGDSTRL